MGKHDKEETLVAQIAGDEYYRAQINTLQRKLEDLQTNYELALEYINKLEREKEGMAKRIEKLKDIALRAMGDTDV